MRFILILNGLEEQAYHSLKCIFKTFKLAMFFARLFAQQQQVEPEVLHLVLYLAASALGRSTTSSESLDQLPAAIQTYSQKWPIAASALPFQPLEAQELVGFIYIPSENSL